MESRLTEPRRVSAAIIPALAGIVPVVVWSSLVLFRSPLPSDYFAERDARHQLAVGSGRVPQNPILDPMLILAERPFMYPDSSEPTTVTVAYVANLPAALLASVVTEVVAASAGVRSIGFRRLSWIGTIAFMIAVFIQWYALAWLAIGLCRLIEPTS